MIRLRDIMTEDVITVGPETSIRDALELLARHHVGGAPVVSQGKVIGVVTATDLMNFASSLPGVPTERPEDDSVPWDEASVEEDVDDEVEPAAGYFAELWEDAGAEVSARLSAIEGPEWNVLEEHDVSEAMTLPPLVALPPEADVVTAAAVMADNRIHRVLVIGDDTLLGIASAFDVVKAVAAGRLTQRVFAFNRDQDFPDR